MEILELFNKVPHDIRGHEFTLFFQGRWVAEYQKFNGNELVSRIYTCEGKTVSEVLGDLLLKIK